MLKHGFLALGLLAGLNACTSTYIDEQLLWQDAGADAPPDAPPDVPAACAAPCASGEHCIDGECKLVDVLALYLGETITSAPGSAPSRENTMRACGTLAMVPSTPALPAPLGAEGPCKVWGYAPDSIAPAPAPQPAAMGSAKFDTQAGVFLLQGKGVDCSTAAPEVDLFAKSGIVTFTGDGIGHFPIFRVEVTPPLPLALTSTPLVRGQPLTLTWQAASSEGVAVDVHTLPPPGSTATTPWISCEAPDTGSLTIPASLTSLLHASGSHATILGLRSTHVVQAPDSSPAVIDATVVRSNKLLLDYAP